MKKKAWIILGIGILVVAAALTAAWVLFFAGGYRIEFEKAFDSELSFEYGQESDIPKAYVVNRYGVRQYQTVTYQFTSADGDVTETEYPVAKCDSVGEWKVRCSSEKAETEKTFRVVDTIAPKIVVGPLPSDVYVGNTEKEYSVPGVNFEDASPIDYDNCSVELFFEGEPVTYNTLTQAFIPERWGEYTLKIKAADIYGNVATEECKWRSKDADWKDESLPEGYLATFDSVGYTNLISSGFINEFWSGTETEEFLEEYQGEKGVVKVNMTYNAWNLTAIKIKLAREITPKQLGDKKIIIRYMVADKNTTGRLTLAGNYVESQHSSVARYFDYTPGEWAIAVISAEDLERVSYADADGVLRTLQLGFERKGSGSTSIYLGSVTVAEKLDKPGNLRSSNGKLSWDAVKGATGYILYLDDQMIELSAAELSYSIGKAKVFRVVAKGDNLFKLDSEEALFVNDSPKDGYLAEFDEEYYRYLVWNNGAGAEGGMEWYESDSFETSFDSKEGALRLELTQGYVGAGIVVRLPKPVSLPDLDHVVIRFKADKNVKCVRVYQYGGEGRMLENANVKEGWNTLVIPKEQLLADYGSTDTFSGYQMIFYSGRKPENGVGQGTEMTIYLSSVTNAEQLSKPENLKLDGNVLTWDAVSGASGYEVIEDGKSVTVKTNTYKTKGGNLFQVAALGDNRMTVTSDYAVFVNATVPEGYIATFDQAFYQYLIWNNGAGVEGGMQWYESDSHKVTYEAATGTTRVDMTFGYVAAGSVVRFPQAVDLSMISDLAVRLKLDDAVKGIAFYQYGGEGLLYHTTAITPGWNTFIIPKTGITAANGTEGFMNGLQIILYSNAEKQHGVKQGSATTMYLGSITSIRRLSQPLNVRVEGSTLTWDPVDGAAGYVVYEDDARYTVKGNTHPLHGGEFLRVQAVGDGITTADSDYAVCINGKVQENYLAEFDKPWYDLLIWNNGAGTEGGMQWYESAAFSAKCDTANQKMDVTAAFGYVCAGMVVKFPQKEPLQTGKDVVVNIKLDDNVKCVSLYPYGVAGLLLKVSDVTSGWNRLVIPAEKLAAAVGNQEFKGLQVILYDNADGGFTQSGTALQTTVSIGKIYYASSLAKPTLTLEETTVKWPAVENADSYDIYVNDEWKCNQTDTSYSVAGFSNGVYSIKVVAKSQREIYLDSVSDPVKYSNLLILKAPAMTYKDGVVSFETVAGCAGYKIEINGTEYNIDKNATSVKLAELTGKSIYVEYRIKAVGDNKTTADSDWSEYQGQDLSLKEGVIADFDEGYTKLVWNNGEGSNGGMQWYECASFAASYDAVEDGIKLDLIHGYVCAGMVVKFPTAAKRADIDNLVIRIKLDANIKMIRIYPYGGIGKIMEFRDLTEGWNELTIPQSKLFADEYLTGLQIIMHTSNNPVNGDSGGTPVTAVLGSIENRKTPASGSIPVSITGVNGSTTAEILYLTLSASTGAGANTWKAFEAYSDTEGIFYNGTKLNVPVQTTWDDAMFCLQHKKSPVAGDTLIIRGIFEGADIKLKVSECTLQYNGTSWEIK